MNNELQLIKKDYGENMMHLCRELFPSILEEKGLLIKTLNKYFAPTHYLYDDICKHNIVDDFKNYIYSLLEFKDIERVVTDKDPFELMDEAGYTLYECKSEKDIQSFKKYYEENEQLCTFRGNRLETCYVFFAVKKNVSEIKRENFEEPQREDLYGTSVISIQFYRGSINNVSIKNRYNHTVNNPDATFSNNLDNIIPGLTDSFARNYNLNINNVNDDDIFINTLFESNYVLADDGKIYNYNYEINNIYFCPNNLIIDNRGQLITKFQDKSRYVFLDYMILDLKKKIFVPANGVCYDSFSHDSFIDSISYIDKVDISVDKEKKVRTITIKKDDEDIIIKLDSRSRIIEYINPCVKNINSFFLRYNNTLVNLQLENVEQIGDDFLCKNEVLENVNLPSVLKVGNDFLVNNKNIQVLRLPELRKVGSSFMYCNSRIKELYAPKLERVGHHCLKWSQIENVMLPSLIEMGICFMQLNVRAKKIILPKLIDAGDLFFLNNISCEEFYVPNLKNVDCSIENYKSELIKNRLKEIISQNSNSDVATTGAKVY